MLIHHTNHTQETKKNKKFNENIQLTLYYYSIQCYHTHFDCFDKHYSAAMDTLTMFDCSDTDWTNSPNSNLNYKGHTLLPQNKTKTIKMEISSKLLHVQNLKRNVDVP